MKKLFPILMALVLISACGKEECKDEYCPSGYSCVDGTCVEDNPTCPTGYEGTDCSTTVNEKFAGNYDVDYTGSGGLSNSNGTTIATVSKVPQKADRIKIEVSLDISASIVGNNIDLPLDVTIEATVVDDTYYVPTTSITTEVDLGLGFPLPIELTFTLDGELVDANTLNSTLVMGGILAGTIEMTGTK